MYTNSPKSDVTTDDNDLDYNMLYHVETMPEYIVWQEMIRRCYEPNHPSYKDFGGMGATVCHTWQIGFGTFLNDVGRMPLDGSYILERIDSTQSYNKDNCRWRVTRRYNTANTSSLPITNYPPATIAVQPMLSTPPMLNLSSPTAKDGKHIPLPPKRPHKIGCRIL
jgi:hypothetical protein